MAAALDDIRYSAGSDTMTYIVSGTQVDMQGIEQRISAIQQNPPQPPQGSPPPLPGEKPLKGITTSWYTPLMGSPDLNVELKSVAQEVNPAWTQKGATPKQAAVNDFLFYMALTKTGMQMPFLQVDPGASQDASSGVWRPIITVTIRPGALGDDPELRKAVLDVVGFCGMAPLFFGARGHEYDTDHSQDANGVMRYFAKKSGFTSEPQALSMAVKHAAAVAKEIGAQQQGGHQAAAVP